MGIKLSCKLDSPLQCFSRRFGEVDGAEYAAFIRIGKSCRHGANINLSHFEQRDFGQIRI